MHALLPVVGSCHLAGWSHSGKERGTKCEPDSCSSLQFPPGPQLLPPPDSHPEAQKEHRKERTRTPMTCLRTCLRCCQATRPEPQITTTLEIGCPPSLSLPQSPRQGFFAQMMSHCSPPHPLCLPVSFSQPCKPIVHVKYGSGEEKPLLMSVSQYTQGFTPGIVFFV
jgi:hypothetical protein